MEPSIKEQLIRAVFRFRRLNMNFPQTHHIRMREFFLLRRLAGDATCEDGRSLLTDMHRHLHITKPAVSQMLNSLEKKAYIRREIDKEDRRKISITITPQGREALRQAKTDMDELLDMTIARFGEENTRQLISLLTLLADVSEGIAAEIKDCPDPDDPAD